ncbi:MAG TPA: PmoA family protein [Planctomycetota bacterium]|jgi:hypothetical protein|nr:PmoA family protein [Planctomycetota bacterium]HNU27512.1 PmoA family protein [Planctomycetota bacterium]HOE31378.1 PmoA family protein [Planctomycetota bacterium]HOE88364.1 PmoA family protein [Planctomycetota bacterium]HOR68988.1 PmoA family protein [Planctomycetota bacterium]
MRKTACVCAALCASLCAAADPAPCAAITVAAGDQARIDTPVAVALPPWINAARELALFEVRDGLRTEAPAQVAFGPVRELRWILSGATPAGTARRFELCYAAPRGGGGVRLALNPRTLDVSVGGAPFFSYNHAHVAPPGKIPPVFIRSGYIHPMFDPSGRLLTEDFPADHYHHKGIWGPWTETTFEGHDVDFWNLGRKLGTVQFAGFERVESGPVFGRFRAKQEHVDLTQPGGGKVALDEVWDVCVWDVGDGGRLWDLTSEQACAGASPLFLKQYRYGGFGYRGPKEWEGDDYKVLTSEGHTKKNSHGKTSRWCAHSGVIAGARSTIIFMCSPRNDRFPEPMRIWESGGCFFNYCPVQHREWTFEPGKTYVFRYRVYIHEGDIDAERAERLWRDFGEPPVATLEPAGSK